MIDSDIKSIPLKRTKLSHLKSVYSRRQGDSVGGSIVMTFESRINQSDERNALRRHR